MLNFLFKDGEWVFGFEKRTGYEDFERRFYLEGGELIYYLEGKEEGEMADGKEKMKDATAMLNEYFGVFKAMH